MMRLIYTSLFAITQMQYIKTARKLLTIVLLLTKCFNNSFIEHQFQKKEKFYYFNKQFGM